MYNLPVLPFKEPNTIMCSLIVPEKKKRRPNQAEQAERGTADRRSWPVESMGQSGG